MNRQVFRIERLGEQSNNGENVDAIGEMKEQMLIQRPSDTYEGRIVNQTSAGVTRFEQPLFDVERGASRD